MTHLKRHFLIAVFAGAAGYAAFTGIDSLQDDGRQVINQSTQISCDSSAGYHADINFDRAARTLSVEAEGQKASVTVHWPFRSISVDHLASGGGTWTCKDGQGRPVNESVRFKL